MSARAKKRYYENNRADILAKRKKRYDTDPVYRQNVIDAVKRSRKKKAQERKIQKALEKLEKKIWKKFTVVDKEIQCCRVGHLAKNIERDVQTIKLWEKKGFPKTFLYKGQRYYTKKHFDHITKLYTKFKDQIRRGNLGLFIQEVSKGWNELYN
jgi:hypothetical protein